MPDSHLAAPGLWATPELSSIDKVAEQRAVINFIDDYRALMKSTAGIESRLANILRTADWWGTIGCQLCFASTGKLEPDHDMNSCGRDAERESAKSILRWLKSLAIPRTTSRGRDFCSTCAPFYPCREVIIGYRTQEAETTSKRDSYTKHPESKPGPDGYCENKPVIRQVIAALCAYDDQFLGKLVGAMASDQGGADLSVDTEARAWFEQRIPFERSWFSNLLLVFETLVLALYFRQNRKRQAPELYGFPHQPAGLTPWPIEPEQDHMSKMRWGDAGEVNHWEASIKWWVGKCSFCAGRGLQGAKVQHTLRQCTRGGKATLSNKLSDAMYRRGFLPSNGCNTCHLPYDLCSAWMRDDEGEWILADAANSCQYGGALLADTIIGLYHCERSEFQEEIMERVYEYCEKSGLEFAFDEGIVAQCLLQEITVAGVSGSEMIRMLAVFTQMVWDATGENQRIYRLETADGNFQAYAV